MEVTVTAMEVVQKQVMVMLMEVMVTLMEDMVTLMEETIAMVYQRKHESVRAVAKSAMAAPTRKKKLRIVRMSNVLKVTQDFTNFQFQFHCLMVNNI